MWEFYLNKMNNNSTTWRNLLFWGKYVPELELLPSFSSIPFFSLPLIERQRLVAPGVQRVLRRAGHRPGSAGARRARRAGHLAHVGPGRH